MAAGKKSAGAVRMRSFGQKKAAGTGKYAAQRETVAHPRGDGDEVKRIGRWIEQSGKVSLRIEGIRREERQTRGTGFGGCMHVRSDFWWLCLVEPGADWVEVKFRCGA